MAKPAGTSGQGTGGTAPVQNPAKSTGAKILDGTQLVLDVAGLVPGIGEVADGTNALIYLAREDKTNAALSGAACVPFAGWAATGGKLVNKGVKAANQADNIYDASRVIQVTKDGVALPPGRSIPSGLVDSPYRSGSYGTFDPITGKYRETLRIDPATQPGYKGPNYSHYHLNNGPKHYSPRPGDSDPWPW